MSRAIASISAALCLVALVGCGEKDEPETTGPVVTTETPQELPTGSPPDLPIGLNAPQAVEAFLVSPDAEAVCDDVLTPKFLRSAYGDRAGCIAARRPVSLADPESKLEVGPASSQGTLVVAEPQGGVYDGEKLRITVIRQGDVFLIDSIESNAPVGP